MHAEEKELFVDRTICSLAVCFSHVEDDAKRAKDLHAVGESILKWAESGKGDEEVETVTRDRAPSPSLNMLLIVSLSIDVAKHLRGD